MENQLNINEDTQTSSTITVHQEPSESLIDDKHQQDEHALRSLNRETSIKSEIFEQSRRVADHEGESRRRITANKVSAMFRLEGKTNRSSIPSFGIAVRDALKKAGTQISTNVVQAKSSTESAGKKGWALLRSKLGEASKRSAADQLDHALIEARIAFANSTLQITKFADNIGEKGNKAAVNASHKGAELVVKGRTGLDLVLYHARILVRDIAVRFSGWVQRTWSHAVLKAHLNYSTHLEEREKKRRTLSDADETFAILNAMRVSSLIKDLAPALYRPTEEPSGLYSVELLEMKERNRRINEDKLDKNLRARCKHTGDLVMAYHASRKVEPKELAPAYTIESVIDAPVKNIESMQIFEEPRLISEIAPVSSPPPKIFADYVKEDSPTARSAAM